MKFKVLEDISKNNKTLYYPQNYKKYKINDNFWKWFGDSKVTTLYGDPLIVYHGTRFNFDNFIPSKASEDFPPAIYFTSNRNIAKSYGDNVRKFFIKLENPLYDDAEGMTYNAYYNWLVETINRAYKSGNDGVIIRRIKDDWEQNGSKMEGTTYVVFDPKNVKAVDNKGTWNETDNIYEDYLVETKQDIEKFVNKFGQETYDLFNKSRDRLKNNGYSTDIIYYTNKVSKEELEDILSKLQRRLKTTNDDGNRSEEGIRGKYKYLGEKDGYKVYQPLDYLASIDLGYMSGWCTTGRYGHAGERDCKPSESDAKEHFEDYTSKGIDLYYFLDSKTMEGEYAIALYPETLEVNQFINDEKYIESTNFEIFNKEDKIDYNAIEKLPIDLIPKLEIESQQAENGLAIKDNEIIKANKNLPTVTIPKGITGIGKYAFNYCDKLKSIEIPRGVKYIGGYAFYSCNNLIEIVLPDSVEDIGFGAFEYCSNLKSIKIPNNIKIIGEDMFYRCISLISIEIPSSVTSIEEYAFESCSSLASITIPDSVLSIGKYAFRNCRNLTIYCQKGSYAEEYAKENNIPYKTTLIESYPKEEIKMEGNKKQLNPILWQNNVLKPDIKKKVEEIVDKFIKGLEEKKISLKIEDIEIVGSNANYNYTTDSDLDIHVVVDMGEYSEEKKELLKLIYEYYKSSFNDKYEIYIKGIPVELYIEDKDTKAISNGVYSVLKDEWVKFPEEIEKQDVDISSEFDYLLKEYNKIKEMGDKEKAEQLLDTLYFNRKRSLALYGEYGVDNLIFKKFRNYGYLEELKEFIKDEESKLLSLENLTNRFLESIM